MSDMRQRRPVSASTAATPSGLLTADSHAYGTGVSGMSDGALLDYASSSGQVPAQTINVLTTPIGVYGWRKYMLYASVLLLLALAIVNVGLLAWIATVLQVKDSHFGPLRVNSDRLQVDGRAEFTQGLLVTNLSGFDQATLALESNSEVKLRAVDAGSNSASQLQLLPGSTALTSPSVSAATAEDPDQPYFEASADTVSLRASAVRVASVSGMTIDGSLQATRVTNAYGGGQGLTLESVGQDLLMAAGEDVSVTSSQGSVSVSAGLDVELTAGNDLVLQADNQLRLSGLPVPAADAGASEFQLCMCASDNRLYRVAAASTCSAGAAAVGC